MSWTLRGKTRRIVWGIERSDLVMNLSIFPWAFERTLTKCPKTSELWFPSFSWPWSQQDLQRPGKK
jgi:hypothetical protein